MSSSLSALIGQASTVYNAVSTLFGGGGNVQLGSFTFAGMEVPEKVTWGGKQDIVLQKMPGGLRQFAAMGMDFPPLTWSGIFEGFTAISRSRQLYTMQASAATFPLTWNDRSYTVMIADYSCDDTKSNWVPYRITCLVLRDETISSNPAAPSLLAAVTGDIASAIGVTSAQLTAGVGTALQVAQQASTVVGAVTAGSSASLALTGAVALATGVVGGALSLANSSMANTIAGAVTSGSSVISSGTAPTGIASLVSSLAASANLASLPIIGGLLGRVTTNMANAST